MKIVSPLPQKKPRLEIVPLIDIMFFLLASFMLVSLTMTKQRSVGVNLPVASSSQSNPQGDSVHLAVGATGQVYLEKQPVDLAGLELLLKERLAANRELPVFISGDAATSHGAMMAVLDSVRRCGVIRVGFNVRPAETTP